MPTTKTVHLTKTVHPFAFEKEGKFSTPYFDYVISVHGAQKLLSHTPRTPQEKKALDALFTALSSLNIETLLSPTGFNDAPEEIRQNAYFKYASGISGYKSTSKPCYVAVQPYTFNDRFYVDHKLTNVTTDPKSWGWDSVLGLRAHKKTLDDLSKDLGVTLNTTLFQRTINIKNLMDKGTIKVRQPNSVADMGRATGFVVYCEKGYMDPKFNLSTIEKAWVFGSERLAQMAINRYGWTNGVMVEVEVALKRVVGSAPDGQLNDALAALQKERMKEALEHMEIEALRERLAQLEGRVDLKDAPPKRRM